MGKRKYRKRRYKRKRRSIQLYNMQSPVPAKMLTKLLYCEQVILDAPAGSSATHVFSANGMFDPNTSAGGHQPRGFDQLMALYDHYVVIGSKITVRASNTGSTAAIIAVGCTDSSSTTSDINNIIELNDTKYRVIDGDTNGCTIVNKTNIRKKLGRSHPLSDPELKGSSTSNPTEGCFYHISVESVDNASNPAAVHLVAKIEYLAYFIERKRMVQS